jgi:hypothetical protein
VITRGLRRFDIVQPAGDVVIDRIGRNGKGCVAITLANAIAAISQNTTTGPKP